MAGVNFRDAYEFDPENGAEQYAGGLLGRLQAMVQQGQLQPVDPGSRPNGANDDGSPQGGLLGRMLALQGGQNSYQPFAASSVPTSSESRDPNFRRLARVYITDPSQDRIDANRPGGRVRGISESSQAFEADNEVPASAIRTAQLAPGIGIPFPPPLPMQPPNIPMPAIPDWWKAAGPILRRALSGMGGGSGDYRRCTSAADGSTEQWEEFCRNLASGTNNTVGGESQKNACWAKTFESPTNKKQWCENQFGDY